jgi:excisionase family DNA binding protein
VTSPDLGDVVAAGDTAAAELARTTTAAGPGDDLADVVAAGEQARAELGAAGLGDAELRAALLRLAHDHPVRVPPPARSPDPSEAGPVDSLAAAADVLRGYLDDDPAVTPARASEALAVVEQHAAAGDNLLPLPAVAGRLGVSVATVRRLISEGELPAARVGYRTMRVPAEGLAAYRARLAAAARHTRPARGDTSGPGPDGAGPR